MRRQICKEPFGILELKQLIGKGSYGQIYRAYASSQDKQYAVKVISPDTDSSSLTNIEREIQILLACNHPNIVKCYGAEVIQETVWLIMDYYSKGSLSDIMMKERKTYSETQIKKIITQILKGLVYLHKQRIIHRDIKAANILVSACGEIKIADFGVSTLINPSSAGKSTRTGSPLWMSPELLSSSNYSFKTDIWSLGITAMQLAQGSPPYAHQHPYRAIFSIQSHPPQSLTQPYKWSESFNDFVSKCLTLDQYTRPTALELLNHQFIISQNSDVPQSNYENKQNILQNHIYSDNIMGTVLLHSSRQESIWEKENNNQKNVESINSSMNGSQKTLTIKNLQIQMEPNLLNQITKAFPLKNIPNLLSKQGVEVSQKRKIQNLYNEMEEEIQKVRRKYLYKIREMQQTSITFEEQLRKIKDKGKKTGKCGIQ